MLPPPPPVVVMEPMAPLDFPPLIRGSPSKQASMNNEEQPIKNFDMILKRNIISKEPQITPIPMRPVEMPNPEGQVSKHTFPPRMLSSGKLVGDPNAWKVINDNRLAKKDKQENRNISQENSNKNAKVYTHNKFDTLLQDEGNMKENKQPVSNSGEHQFINKEVDNCSKPQSCSKSVGKSSKRNSSLQWGIRVEEEQEAEEEFLFEDAIQRNIVEIVTQAAQTGSKDQEVMNDGGEGYVEEKDVD
ncbi:hypothetical protein HAX54_035154 [Datura stramonium]|uniref:Uncharacterized protein n=1 Tax=Datura stramonium TaxID=4076 RepID=A0ABS8SF92_DATST|nr:hypothetical protein [Datura stramonium]